jgi:chemotaxis protein methyltransferase CheR
MRKPQSYSLIKNFIAEKYGLLLPKELRPLARSHLCTFQEKYKVESWEFFFRTEEQIFESKKLEELVEIFLVGHTNFFRDNQQFELFKDVVIPSIISEKVLENDKLDLKIWSAGCSTGEEPYSILISLMDFFGSSYGSIKCGCLATDISEKSLVKAREGIYTKAHYGKLCMTEYSNYIHSTDKISFQIKDFLKQEAVFRHFNLNNQVYPFKNNFQVIFCRNVLIYFNNERRNHIVKNIVNHLDYNGFLLVGNSENFEYTKYGLIKMGHAVFKKVRP